jgi:DNA (cytosine-5)-methyltransferase 1
LILNNSDRAIHENRYLPSMGLVFGSVCSGIEAASVAWEPLGWKAAWLSEIEPFPNAVLAYHWPEVPNLGDMTKIHDNEIFKTKCIDLLVGGTPCQSFSVAGNHGGLEDDRGNLALVYCELAKRAEPRWVVWENVPGVLSSGGGRDFGSLLGALGKFGYGYAYRVLDAQHFGVPQRRRRVFVVGYCGDWRPAAAVLFEPPSGTGTVKQGVAVPGDGLDEVRSDPKVETVVTKDGEELSCNSGRISRTLQARGVKRLNPGSESFITDGRGRTRYLTPTEWERLMGFKDNFTQVPFRGVSREKCPESLRYTVLGNSMVVPVMRWIGERIQMVDNILQHPEGADPAG